MSVSTSVSGPLPAKRLTTFKSILTNARYPLQISIAVVFTLLITVLGTTLVLYNYSKNKTITLLAAADLFDRITRQTATNIRKLYVPAEILVDATAQLEATEGESLAERLRLLKYFSESLRNNPNLASIYIGYENGEFFLIRAIRGNQQVRQSIDAPQDAYFAVQSIELMEDGKAQQRFLYYDEKPSLLGMSNILDTNYDPRSRGLVQISYRCRSADCQRHVRLFHYPRARHDHRSPLTKWQGRHRSRFNFKRSVCGYCQ